MNKNLIFFIKKLVKGKEGVDSSHTLFEVESVNFADSEVKEILIEDSTGLQNSVRSFGYRDIWWEFALEKKINFLEMKIGDFSIENGRLIIRDKIKKENTAIPQTDNLKEFSVFCQPVLGTGFLPFSSGSNGDNTDFVRVSKLVDILAWHSFFIPFDKVWKSIPKIKRIY